MILDQDTICALATAPGGAIAIIRVSGQNAIDYTNAIFKTNRGDLNSADGYTIHYGQIVNENDEFIDDVLISVFKAPHSYTGEDSTEISCHGSAYIVHRIIGLLLEKGCRQATPGEFTQRAFLNGKMDLSQAEAVADLISASNTYTHKMAVSQLKGNFSNELKSLRDELLHLTTLLELELDFTDQDVMFADRNTITNLIEHIDNKVLELSSSFEKGNAIKKGIAVALVGKTNVGKSTLLNSIIGEDKAIVSDIHGTTRDIVEDVVNLKGVNFRFIDTAGIRQTKDKIENIGIAKTYETINKANIVLWVIDHYPTEEDILLIEKKTGEKPTVIIQNKIDLEKEPSNNNIRLNPNCTFIQISAKSKQNLKELENKIIEIANIPEITENDVIVTNIRHYKSLMNAHEIINNIKQNIADNAGTEMISEYLRQCIDELGEIIGGTIHVDETLKNVFGNFCIGK